MATYDQILKHTEGLSISGAAIRNKNSIFIFFQNSYDEYVDNEVTWRQRAVLIHYQPHADSIWSGEEYSGFPNVMSIPLPDDEMIFVDENGIVITAKPNGGKTNFIIQKPIDKEDRDTLTNMVLINGKAYVAGTGRSAYIREREQWFSFGPGCTEKEEESILPGGTFNVIDGFSSDDVYAGGGGDFWHYNGEDWKSIDIPTNQVIYAICCAGNGKAYVGCSGGVLLEGRGNSWEIIPIKGYMDSTLIVGLNWFKDRLFIIPANSFEGLYEYKTKPLWTKVP